MATKILEGLRKDYQGETGWIEDEGERLTEKQSEQLFTEYLEKMEVNETVYVRFVE